MTNGATDDLINSILTDKSSANKQDKARNSIMKNFEQPSSSETVQNDPSFYTRVAQQQFTGAQIQIMQMQPMVNGQYNNTKCDPPTLTESKSAPQKSSDPWVAFSGNERNDKQSTKDNIMNKYQTHSKTNSMMTGANKPGICYICVCVCEMVCVFYE